MFVAAMGRILFYRGPQKVLGEIVQHCAQLCVIALWRLLGKLYDQTQLYLYNQRVEHFWMLDFGNDAEVRPFGQAARR
jgi:hypothetical protein